MSKRGLQLRLNARFLRRISIYVCKFCHVSRFFNIFWPNLYKPYCFLLCYQAKSCKSKRTYYKEVLAFKNEKTRVLISLNVPIIRIKLKYRVRLFLQEQIYADLLIFLKRLKLIFFIWNLLTGMRPTGLLVPSSSFGA